MAVPLAIAISPLYSKFDISSIKIITEQSLSGGGRDMLLSGKSGVHIDCEIPGEEKSIVNELTNIFASLNDDINQLKVPYIEAKCSRVMRDYGHLAIVEIDFSKDISAHSIINSWQEYIPLTKQLKLPSSPKQVIELIDGKLNTDVHRWAGSESRDPNTDLSSAMSVAVGEVEVKGNKLKFTLVSDNTIRGAAGYSVLLAELILADGILHDKNTILNSPI
jgi:aspartate-semialdehyde dehydrogenase